MEPLTYRISGPIKVILQRWDWLGFDNEKDAADAILNNEDWPTRWDLSDACINDLQVVVDWKQAVLLDNKVNGIPHNIIPPLK